MHTRIQKLKEINKNQNDILRNILNKIPNKNSLYRKIKLPISYLNLKSFLNGKEKLKEKSENHLLNTLNLEKFCLYINVNELNETELAVLENLYKKMFTKFENFADEFKNEKRKSSPKDITENDLKKVNELIKDVSDFKADNDSKFLDIDLFDPSQTLDEIIEEDNGQDEKFITENNEDEIQIDF